MSQSLNRVKKTGHRFGKGNKYGRGNPLAKQINQLRAELAATVTREDVNAIAKKLIEDAKAGKVASAHELFDRLFGKANQPIELTGNLAVKTKQGTFDYAGFIAELEQVQREREAAAGRVRPANRN